MSCWLPSPDSKLFIRFLELLNSFIWSCFTCMFRRCKMCLRSPPISDILELCNTECLSGAVVPCDLHNETVVEIDTHQLFELDYHWGFQQHDRTRTPYHKYPKQSRESRCWLEVATLFSLASVYFYSLSGNFVTSLISASSEFGGTSNQRHRAARRGDSRAGNEMNRICPVRKFCDMRELWDNQNTILQSYSCMCYEFLRGILTWKINQTILHPLRPLCRWGFTAPWAKKDPAAIHQSTWCWSSWTWWLCWLLDGKEIGRLDSRWFTGIQYSHVDVELWIFSMKLRLNEWD